MKQAVVSVYFLTYLRAGSFSGKRPRLEWFILKKGKAGLAPLKNFNTQHDFHDSKLTWTKNACIDLIICFDLYHQFIILFVFKKQWDLYNCTRGPWTATLALIKVDGTKLTNIFTRKKYSKLVQFSGKRHSVSVHLSKRLQKGPFL